MKWIKFLSDYTQKGKDGSDDKNFKEGDIVQVDESVAKALIDLDIAEEAEEPKADDNLDKSVESLTKSVETTVQTVLEKALEKVSENFNETAEKSFAVPKDPNSELTAEYGFKDAGHFFKSVQVHAADGNIPGMEFLTKAPSGQNISTDSEGGFLVPEPIANRIWTNLMDEPDSIIPQTLQMTTAGNSMKVPRFFESTRKTGVGGRNGGIISYWVDEAGALTASQFTTGRENLELHKLAALVYATSEMLEDSGFSVEGFINQLAPRAINFEIANAIINGTGVGKPQGVLKSDALIVVPALDRTGASVGNNEMSHYMLSQMYWRNIQRNDAIWYGHPGTVQQLEFVVFDDDTTNRRPVYFPAGGMGTGGLTQPLFGTVYGRPVIPYEFMPASSGEGDLAFISWRDYATLQKAGGGIRFASSIHVRFLNDETAYRFLFRIDGRALWTSAKEDLNGNTTRSPFTCTASRSGGGSSSGL